MKCVKKNVIRVVIIVAHGRAISRVGGCILYSPVKSSLSYVQISMDAGNRKYILRINIYIIALYAYAHFFFLHVYCVI